MSILALWMCGGGSYILRSLGWLVVAQEPLEKADILVVAIDANGAGTLEAADLVHRGVSTQVAVFNDPPGPVDREFIRRGLPYEDRGAVSTRQLLSLGIQNVKQIPRRTTGSEQEGDILPTWCEEQGYHSVILITSSDHSRRVSRILRRSVRGHWVRVSVKASPYSEFDPNAWWKTREGARTEIFELEKLILDVIRHPFS